MHVWIYPVILIASGVALVLFVLRYKQAWDGLRESEARLKAALECSGEGVWDRNLQTGQGVYSQRCWEMLGYTDDVLGAGDAAWSRYIHPEDLPRFNEILQAHLEGQTAVFLHEQRMLCSEGIWKWILIRGMLLSRDMDGKPLRLVGTMSDITDRRLSQKLQIHAVLEASTEAKLLVNFDGSISYANKVAALIFGYSMTELIGLNVDLLVPTSSRDRHSQYRVEFMRHPQPRPLGANRYLTALRRDGSEFPVELGLSPIMMDGRTVVMASIIDITERKQAEQILLRAKESAEEALERARMAEYRIINISEETREKIGQELHDNLGQHLTGVAFLSEVLNTKLKKKEWPEMQLVSKITTLINDAVLNTRQLAQGLYPVELKAAGLQAMLGQLASQIGSIYKIDCEVQYDESFLVEDNDVAINLFRIAQEATNNAIKHGGATQITIRTVWTEDARFLEIADNGCGISSRGEHAGMGMHTMHYRAALIGASLGFGVSLEGGASVFVSFTVQ